MCLNPVLLPFRTKVLVSTSMCHTVSSITRIADSHGATTVAPFSMASTDRDFSAKVRQDWLNSFRIGAPTRFRGFLPVCQTNVHKRCQKNVANNCGINARQLADILNDMGMTPATLSGSAKPKKRVRTKGNKCGKKDSNFTSSCASVGWFRGRFSSQH